MVDMGFKPLEKKCTLKRVSVALLDFSVLGNKRSDNVNNVPPTMEFLHTQRNRMELHLLAGVTSDWLHTGLLA